MFNISAIKWDLLIVAGAVVSWMAQGSVLSTNKVAVLDTAGHSGEQHMETTVARQLCFDMYFLYNYHIN